MADQPISALTLYTTYHPADEVEILDTTDTTFASTGTNKRIQFSTLLAIAAASTRDIYNAKLYGAVGNGVTDDTSAIQSALNAAFAAGGGCVYLPSGTYMVTNKLLLQTGCRFTGDGYSSQIIGNVTVGYLDPQEGFDVHPVVEVPSNNYGTCFDHIRITAPQNADPRIYGWHGRPSSFQNWVHHCWIENFTGTAIGGIDPSNSYNNLIEANIVVNCVNGISLTGTVAQAGNQLIGNQVTGGVVGLHMEWPIKAVISGNRFEGSQSAINLNGTYLGEGQVIITGNVCVCTGTGAAVVALTNGSMYGMVQNLIFSNNTVLMTNGLNSSDAIQCLGVNGCVFANNIILSATQSASCIAFRGTDTNNLVTGNYLKGGFNGVLMNQGGAVNNTIAGNTFQSQTRGPSAFISLAPQPSP